MRLIFSISTLIGLLGVLISGCQGNPAIPNTISDLDLPQVQEAADQSHHCLGYNLVVFDTRQQTVQVVPARSSVWHLNMTGVLNGTMGVTAAGVPSESDPASGLFVFDVTLIHPFPTKPQFAGFDVKGILITPGSYTDIPGIVLAGVDESRLENADGFTRWWNPTEFTEPGLFGYIKGMLANSESPVLTATVNPYKGFADILDAQESFDYVYSVPLDDDLGRGVFKAGSSNTRRYNIRFPMNPGPVIKYGYAVDVSWRAPVPNPPTEIPDDFPIEANQPEAYNIWTFQPVNSLYFDTETGHGGGSLWYTAGVRDWQGQANGNATAQIEGVNLWCPELSASAIPMDYSSEDTGEVVFVSKLWSQLNPTEPGDFPIAWQVISAGGPTYKQGAQPAPSDTVAAWQVGTVTVTDPDCVADTNNDPASAETTNPYSPVTDGLCFTEDPVDWYKFSIPNGMQASGNIWFVHDAGYQLMNLCDSNLNVIVSGVPYDGYTEITIEPESPLYADTYYLSVKLDNDVGAILYMIAPQLEFADITPAPEQIETARLDCEPSWVKVMDSMYALFAGAAGTWAVYTPDLVPAAIGRTYDKIYTRPACSNYQIYYWEDSLDNPAGIDLVDYTNHTLPIHSEDVLVLPYYVKAITMNSTYLFVAFEDAGTSKISIYDWASDPQNPQLIQTFTTYEDVQQMETVGDEVDESILAVMTFHRTTLYDVLDPDSPALIDYQDNIANYNSSMSFTSTSSEFEDVCVTSFDLDGNGYLRVYLYEFVSGDFLYWGEINLEHTASCVFQKYPWAYVGDRDGITPVNIANYNDFQIAPTVKTVSGAAAIDGRYTYLEVANAGTGFSTFDVTDPSAPIETKRSLFLNNPRDGFVYGEYGFFAETTSYYGALKVVSSIGYPKDAKVRKECIVNGLPNLICHNGNKLLMGSMGSGRIWLFDISDPLNPEEVYAIGLSYSCDAICIEGIAMYAAVGNGTLKVYDIAAFPNVTPKADVPLPGGNDASKMVYHNGRLFISEAGSDAIWTYDATNPYAPAYLDTFNVGSEIRDMEFGTYIYKHFIYCTTSSKFLIIDANDQDNLALLSSIDTPYAMNNLTVDGPLAFMCEFQHSPSIATVFPPQTPAFLGATFPEVGDYWISGLLVNNGYLLEMRNHLGFSAFDLYP